MRKLFLLLFIIFICACSRETKEYYDNGNLKKVYIKKNNLYEGLYQEYYQSGALKLVHIYQEGKLKDSSLYYNKESGTLDYIDYYQNNDTTYQKYFYKDGTLKKRGELLSPNIPIGKWEYYNKQGSINRIKEHKKINGKPYLNQDWYFDKNGDTLRNEGSYFSLKLEKDTIIINEPVKVLIDLIEPLFKDHNSSIKVVIPKDYSENFNKDFSNDNQVKKDTTYNLNIEKEYRDAIGLNSDFRKTVLFGRYFNKLGLQKLRGILIEYYSLDKPDADSLNYYETKKYFERDIFVIDTTKN